MALQIDEIKQALLWAHGLDGEPLLNDSQADFRATAIAEEMRELKFELKISPWQNQETSRGWLVYPAYELLDDRYDLNSIGPGDKGQFAINGPGISCGDLLTLGRACELKRKFFPSGWPTETKTQLCDHQSHLDAVEEILWLSRFQGVKNVQPNIKHPTTGKDVDWAFTACTQPIQIEVKNRRKEFVGIIDEASKGRGYQSWHQDLLGKFSRREADAINVACISTCLGADEELGETVHQLLASGEPIDALVLWTHHCPGGQQWNVFASNSLNRQIVSSLMAPIPREISEKQLRLKNLLRNPYEQRVLKIDELLRIMNDLP